MKNCPSADCAYCTMVAPAGVTAVDPMAAFVMVSVCSPWVATSEPAIWIACVGITATDTGSEVSDTPGQNGDNAPHTHTHTHTINKTQVQFYFTLRFPLGRTVGAPNRDKEHSPSECALHFAHQQSPPVPICPNINKVHGSDRTNAPGASVTHRRCWWTGWWPPRSPRRRPDSSGCCSTPPRSS